MHVPAAATIQAKWQFLDNLKRGVVLVLESLHL